MADGIRIVFSEVAKRFDERVVFRSVAGEAAPGEVLAVTGPNGSGKSTLLAILSGLLFARFTRPTARIAFSRNAIIAPSANSTSWFPRISADGRFVAFAYGQKRELSTETGRIYSTMHERYYQHPHSVVMRIDTQTGVAVAARVSQRGIMAVTGPSIWKRGVGPARRISVSSP